MRPPLLYPLFAGIENLNGIGEKTAKLVRNLTGDKIVDLLWHLPSSIIDRRYSPRLANARIGSIVTVKIRVLEHIEPKLEESKVQIGHASVGESVLFYFVVGFLEIMDTDVGRVSYDVIYFSVVGFYRQSVLVMYVPCYVFYFVSVYEFF